MDDKSLSNLWRTNRSKDAGTDLASVIDGARIIAQSLVPNTEITFAGVKTADTDRKTIRLSAKYIGNEFPVSGDKVDRLLGLTVHELGHILFSEDKGEYLRHIAGKIGYHSYKDYHYLDNVVNVFEDIFVDHLMTAYPGYHDYLRREREFALTEFNLPKLMKPLSVKCDRQDILNAFVYFTLAGGKVPASVTQENMEILGKLANIANRMVTKQMDKDKAIAEAWRVLNTLPAFIDHNQDSVVNMPDESAGTPTEPEQTPTSEPEPGKGQANQEEPVEELEEQPTDNKPESTEEAGEQPTENEPESGESKGEEGEHESESEPTDEPSEDKESEDGGDSEESDELEENAEGSGAGDTATNEPEDEPEPATPEPLPQWQPVNLAEHLNDLVNDKTQLKPKIAQEVAEAVVEKRADLSQLVSYLASESDDTILAYTPLEDAEASTEARSHTAEAEEKLRRILQDYRTKRTKDYRGLMSGRVSNRRLYRVAYGDQRVFQRRERPEEVDMVVCLLMDLSGSVSHYQELIDQIVCAITDAFTKEKLEFIALGYSESGNIVRVPRLYDKETGKVNLELKYEWGSTPSYEGLAAAVAQLLRLGGTKKKVLFHFTDGQPNSAKSPIIPNLLEDARSKGIIDIHICLSADGTLKPSFGYLYGENLLAIADISQLPEVVDKMLREKLEI